MTYLTNVVSLGFLLCGLTGLGMLCGFLGLCFDCKGLNVALSFTACVYVGIGCL